MTKAKNIVSGVVTKADSTKRFGFIQVEGEEKGIFFHFDDLPKDVESVRVGSVLQGTIEEGPKGLRLQKIGVKKLQKTNPSLFYGGASAVVFVLLSVLIWKTWNVSLPGAALVAINITALVVMGFDKALAQSGSLRTPESVLYVLALLGGSPGTFLAMHVFKHKRLKAQFNFVLLLIFVAQIAVIKFLKMELFEGR